WHSAHLRSRSGRISRSKSTSDAGSSPMRKPAASATRKNRINGFRSCSWSRSVPVIGSLMRADSGESNGAVTEAIRMGALWSEMAEGNVSAVRGPEDADAGAYSTPAGDERKDLRRGVSGEFRVSHHAGCREGRREVPAAIRFGAI